ncbi:putative FAD-binding, type PCMH, subdomain 1 [Helianthus anomalus]
MTSMSNSLTGFSSALSAVTGMIYCFPLCTNRTEPTIITPTDETQIQTALLCAKKHGYEFRIRDGCDTPRKRSTKLASSFTVC